MNDPVDTDYANIMQMHHELFEKADALHLSKLARASRQKALADLSQSPGSATSALDLGSLSTRTVQFYWWVPAGFALLVLLRSIMGG